MEVGARSIRAAILTGRNTEPNPIPIPLGYSSAPYSCPSVAVSIPNDGYLFGDRAKDWLYSNPGGFIHLADVDAGSVMFGKVYKALFLFVLDRLRQCGWERPVSCTVIVPTGYAVSDPRKQTIANAAKEAGIPTVRFQYDIIALCSKKASLSDGESLLAFDLGYSGLSLSVVTRKGSDLKLAGSVRNAEVGGRVFDGLLFEDILNWMSADSRNDVLSNLLFSNGVAACAERVKEDLSRYASVRQPAVTTEYSIDRDRFNGLITPSFATVPQSCKEVLEQARVEYGDIHQLILCGGCSAIPFVSDFLVSLFARNGNDAVQVLSLAQTPDYSFGACLGGFSAIHSLKIVF